MIRATTVAAILTLVLAAPAAAVDDVTVTISPIETATSVGTKIAIEVTVENTGSAATGDLAVHIDVTDPTNESSVDPEDWVAELTKSLGSVGPGERGALRWTLSPIAAGDYALYAVVLDRSSGVQPSVLASSNAVPVRVTEERSLNPGGVLPLVVGLPLAIGVLLAWRNRPHRQ